jgi:hypothetical protein
MTADELAAFGMEQLSAAAIEDFLASQGTGVLALPTDAAPYVVPMSFGYDGGRRLYFTFVAGAESRKADLAAGGGPARFLVYSVDTPFNWRSVVLTGTIDELPRSEWDEHATAMEDNAWYPDLLERALAAEDVRVFVFDIEDWDGFSHAGLPPGFDRED